MPVLTGSVHARILTKPSRAGFEVVRLELIEPGAATCLEDQAKLLSGQSDIWVPVQQYHHGLAPPPRGAGSSGHDS